MIYFYEAEIDKICKFLGVAKTPVMDWLKKNEQTDKYIEFVLISSLGSEILTLTYGKNGGSKVKVECQASCGNITFIE